MPIFDNWQGVLPWAYENVVKPVGRQLKKGASNVLGINNAIADANTNFWMGKPKEQPIADAPPAPMITQPTQQPTGAPSRGQMLKQQMPPASPASPTSFGSVATRPPIPAPGTARAWSNENPHPQEYVTPEHQPGRLRPTDFPPAPIGHARPPVEQGPSVGGVGGDAMGSMAAGPIRSFYDSIGLPLDSIISQAQHDEQLGRNAFQAREGREAVQGGLQTQMMAHQLAHEPQADALRVLQTLGQPDMFMFVQTPEGKALINHYMQQLMPQTVTGTSPASAPATPATTPTEAPQVPGGGWRAALRTGMPALAGTAGWAGAGGLSALSEGALAPYSFPIKAGISTAAAYGANKLMDYLDPQGMEAVQQHPGMALAGGALGAYGGSKGFGRMGAKTATPTPGVSPGVEAEVTGQTPTITSQAASKGMTAPGIGAGAGHAPWEYEGGEPTPSPSFGQSGTKAMVGQFELPLPKVGAPPVVPPTPKVPIATNPVPGPAAELPPVPQPLPNIRGEPETVQQLRMMNFSPEQIAQIMKMHRYFPGLREQP